MTDGTGFPSQKELEKEISDYLTRKYGERVKIVSTGLFPLPEKGETESKPTEKKKEKTFQFSLTPEELVNYLDDYVVKQDEAKAVLATKICTHFNRIRYTRDRPHLEKRSVGRIKSNVLLIGPTGVGKTFLIKLIAQRIGVPFVKGDATKFSETGYVGGDVEDLVRDLVRQADGDVDQAQYGIIYVDEIDKISSSQNRWGADVSRTGVQRALLKPMEETEVDLKVPHDPISQLEAIEHYRSTGKRTKRVINTKNILFIVSGAFSELVEIIRKRVQKQSIGFESSIPSKHSNRNFFNEVRAEDLIQYGFESEFVGRLPVIAVLDELSEEDLYEILLNPNSSVVVGKKQDFHSYGINILFEDEALREVAVMAAQEKTGARGLVSVLEKVLLPFEKKLPSTDIQYLVITKDMIRNPHQELDKMLDKPDIKKYLQDRYEKLAEEERKHLIDFILRTRGDYLEVHNVLPTPSRLALIAKQCQEENMDSRDVCDIFIDLVRQIRRCAVSISEKTGLEIAFSEEAIDHILEIEPRNEQSINTICDYLMNTYEYGLRLLSHKHKKNRVVITGEGVDAPDKFINSLVGESFKE